MSGSISGQMPRRTLSLEGALLSFASLASLLAFFGSFCFLPSASLLCSGAASISLPFFDASSLILRASVSPAAASGAAAGSSTWQAHRG